MELQSYPYNYIVILKEASGRFAKTYQANGHGGSERDALMSVLEQYRDTTMGHDGQPVYPGATVVRIDTLVEFKVGSIPAPAEFDLKIDGNYST